MTFELRRADARVKVLVTCLLATLGMSYLFGGWMVALFAGFTPQRVAETYAGPEMAMHMPPDSTVVVEHAMTMEEIAAADHHEVDLELLVQDTHVHLPVYGLIAGVLGLIALGLAVPRAWQYALVGLLFAAPALDFAGMWLTKLAWRGFAVVTVAGGWAMALGYLLVTVLAIREMWFSRKGATS